MKINRKKESDGERIRPLRRIAVGKSRRIRTGSTPPPNAGNDPLPLDRTFRLHRTASNAGSGPPATAIAARRDPERRLRRRIQDVAGLPVAPESCRTSFAAQCKTVKPHTPDPAAPPREKPRPETRNPPTHRTKKNRPPFSRHSGRRRRSSESTKRRGGSDKPSESASPIARPAPRPDALLFHAVLFAHAAFRFADELHQTVAFG